VQLSTNLRDVAICVFLLPYHADISKIVYACRKTPEMVKKRYYEGTTSNDSINKSNNRQIELVFIPDYEQECLDTVKNGKLIIQYKLCLKNLTH